MANPTSTDDYPVLTAATAKQEMLKELAAVAHGNTALWSVIYRINNTDLSGTTDGATIYDDADTFTSAVS